MKSTDAGKQDAYFALWKRTCDLCKETDWDAKPDKLAAFIRMNFEECAPVNRRLVTKILVHARWYATLDSDSESGVSGSCDICAGCVGSNRFDFWSCSSENTRTRKLVCGTKSRCSVDEFCNELLALNLHEDEESDKEGLKTALNRLRARIRGSGVVLPFAK